jgi:hypothetical protein
MNTEDEEFNRIEREASLRKAAVREAVSQRQWIGLTDEEIEKWTPEIHGVIRTIEAILKERNT